MNLNTGIPDRDTTWPFPERKGPLYLHYLRWLVYLLSVSRILGLSFSMIVMLKVVTRPLHSPGALAFDPIHQDRGSDGRYH